MAALLHSLIESAKFISVEPSTDPGEAALTVIQDRGAGALGASSGSLNH
jgi:hypothetical protein